MPKGRRSVADFQNYGDDVPARDLVNPPAFADLSIPPDVMRQARSKDSLIELFCKIGYDHIHPDIWDAIFRNASNGSSHTSINVFRNSLNEYLDAIETGREEEWLHVNLS